MKGSGILQVVESNFGVVNSRKHVVVSGKVQGGHKVEDFPAPAPTQVEVVRGLHFPAIEDVLQHHSCLVKGVLIVDIEGYNGTVHVGAHVCAAIVEVELIFQVESIAQ